MGKRSLWSVRRVRADDRAAEIEEEIAHHLALRADEARSRGSSEAEARREAERAFGDRRRIEAELLRMRRRRARRAHRASVLEAVRVDLRQSFRSFVRRPGVPVLVVLTLALGIGATTAVYTLFERIVLNPLPVRDAERLVVLRAEQERGRGAIAYPMLKALRDSARGFEAIAGSGSMRVTVRAGALTDQVSASVVTGDYFSVLGVRPSHGRVLQSADEAAPGTTPYVVLSDVLWRRAFGADPEVVGSTIRINTHPFTIVGIAPAGFRGTDLASTAELWLPITMVQSIGSGGIYSMSNALEVESLKWLAAVGRLRRGADVAAAVAALDARFVARQRSLPERQAPGRSGEVERLRAVSVQEAATGRSRADVLRLMTILAVVVGICLAVACVNVANLLLLRAADRWRELGVRMALGASRARMFRQALLESVILGVGAGAVGVLVAQLGLRLLAAYTLPGGIDLADARLDPDSRVLAFTSTLSIGTALIFGMAPALRASRPSLVRGLRELRYGAAGGVSSTGVLIALQAALSIVLVVGALLFTRSLRLALTEDFGYRTGGVAAATLNVSQSGYIGEAGDELLRRIVERLQAQPAIEAAAVATFVPPGDAGIDMPVAAAATGRTAAGGRLAVNAVTADYLPMLRVPLLAGRHLRPADEREDAPHVAVVTRSAARDLWPDEEPLGQVLNLYPGFIEDSWTVVGVVEDAHFGPIGEIAPSVFLPYSKFAGPVEVTLLARSTLPPDRTLETMRRTLHALDPELPMFDARQLEQQLARVLMPQRMGATLLGLFAVLAVAISGIGMYATTAYEVTRRRRELGIRAALGAHTRHLARPVLGRTAIAIVAGTAAGLVAAALLTDGLRAFLYGITPHEPVSYAVAPAMLGIIAAFAMLVPLLRARRANPAEILRDSR